MTAGEPTPFSQQREIVTTLMAEADSVNTVEADLIVLLKLIAEKSTDLSLAMAQQLVQQLLNTIELVAKTDGIKAESLAELRSFSLILKAIMQSLRVGYAAGFAVGWGGLPGDLYTQRASR